MTVRDVVGIDLLAGEPTAQCTDELRRDVGVLLDQLRWWGLALRDGRAARPYVS
ncbi:hypothetical protein ACLQ3B_18660 [Micromonospora sp. DT53]